MKKLDNSCGIVLFKVIPEGLNHYLVVQEKAGHWGIPKGHPEEGETKKATAARELFEETGIEDIEFLDLPIITEEYDYAWGENEYHKTVDYFIAAYKSGDVTIQEKEIADCRWVTIEEAQEVLTYDNGKEVLRKAQVYLDEYESEK